MTVESSLVAHKVVRVPTADGGYDIVVGVKVWPQLKDLPAGGSALVVTNDTVAPIYLDALRHELVDKFRRVEVVVLPDGEVHKTLDTLQVIFATLLGQGFDRRTTLFALGGGVVGDMTGFAAATYMRGVPYVQIPTSLLAQVDSSVGGKTAVNHPLGKNMIGAFYQPIRVICDLAVLDTLPEREISAGLAEVIKYGPIYDAVFLEWLEVNIDALRRRDKSALAHAVRRCCEIKAEVVGQDERESGMRAILNFGHTFGHAIEAGLGFGVWLHGEAVGAGMVMAAELSHLLGLVDRGFVVRLRDLIRRAGLPTQGPASMTPQQYLQHMRVDKKSEGGDIRFVLIDGVGRAVVKPAPEALVVQAIQAHTAAT